MKYANWEKTNNLKKDLIKINLKKEEPLLKSGIPVIYEGDDCYITNDGGHTLIVGSTGSGKTQTMILPLIKLSPAFLRLILFMPSTLIAVSFLATMFIEPFALIFNTLFFHTV